MTDFASQAEGYIRDTLIALTDLAAIRAYILGALPSTQINEGMYPLCQILIVPQSVSPNSSLTFWERDYTGRIMFLESQTTAPGAYRDFSNYTEVSDVTIRPPSYARIRGYAQAARDELSKFEHLDMGGLLVAGEFTCNFQLGNIEVGAGADGARPNTWTNVAAIEFSITTQKRRE